MHNPIANLFKGKLYNLPTTLDSTFDAGGKIKSGLIIANTMCQR